MSLVSESAKEKVYLFVFPLSTISTHHTGRMLRLARPLTSATRSAATRGISTSAVATAPRLSTTTRPFVRQHQVTALAVTGFRVGHGRRYASTMEPVGESHCLSLTLILCELEGDKRAIRGES